MVDARFLQIHTLHGYSAVLLNRDDAGFAKRLPYGGVLRTRISSQCLKRHWRMATGVHALDGIDGATAAVRSRDTVTRRVVEPLVDGPHHPDAVAAIASAFQTAVYGEKGDERGHRQLLLLGEPEIAYLAAEARRIAERHGSDPEATRVAANAWANSAKVNMKVLRESCALPGGLAAALFGRMVTADVEANIDAAVHVAHAFTVHAEESESDYIAAVDDLQRAQDDTGAAHVREGELTSGLFYGYVVVDRPVLLDNLGGDTAMAGEVVTRLLDLIATVSPGAKRGPTAPYGYAQWMLVEAGDWQPRSLAEAFRVPCAPTVADAELAAEAQLEKLDRIYTHAEARRVMSVNSAESLALPVVAEWAGAAMREGTA